MMTTNREATDTFNSKIKNPPKNACRKSQVLPLEETNSKLEIQNVKFLNSEKREKDPIIKITYTSRISLNFLRRKSNLNSERHSVEKEKRL